MKRLLASVTCLIFLAGGAAHAQAAGATEGVTTPASPQPGAALPHPNGEMPTTSAGSAKPPPERYSTQAAARAACGGDAVVWGRVVTRQFVSSRAHSFGKTANGFYACRQQALSAGYTGGRAP